VEDRIREKAEALREGNPKYRPKLKEQKKLFCRDRLARLLDPNTPILEDGLFANQGDPSLPADGVVTGIGTMHGRRVAFMANDTTVKAGSWGARTVEKIVRIQEAAGRYRIPLVYLVDSAGARITDQIDMFPGRRHAGKIFREQVRLSGMVPQVCVLFGPSAAGGAYIPAFCDVVIMVEGNASMYLGSPRMAEMVIGEKVTLEEMGGARMHCAVSGCGDVLVASEEEAIAAARAYLAYFPSNADGAPPPAPPAPAKRSCADLASIVPAEENKPFDVRDLLDTIVDADSFFEIKRLWAGELITGLARIEGRAVGILANQPKVKGGVLFVDSADKATRFLNLCDAFRIPLLFLADVPGFMIGTQVERQGIIRAGAKMIAAVSEATVPKISVIVRKAYGAGLYAMCGPAYDPEAAIALPTAKIAVMGPEAAINAVFYNKIQEAPEKDRPALVEKLRAEYREDVDLLRLAGNLHVDHVLPFAELRDELARRFAAYETKAVDPPRKRHGVWPV